jgi:hypothetical protein
MGHCCEFGYVLLAIAANLDMRYGPLRRIWSSSMGHCCEFGYAKRTTAANLVIRYEPLCGMKLYSKYL